VSVVRAQVLNTGTIAATVRGRVGADAALVHACCAAAPVEVLLRVIARNPAREVALSALRVIRIAHAFSGWTPSLEACASREALKALLMLSAGVIKPNVASCSDHFFPMQIIAAALMFSVARADVARRLASIRSFWPLSLAGLLRGDNTTAMQAWAVEQRFLRPQLQSSVAHNAAMLVALTLSHVPEAAPEASLAAPLLAALCASLASAPSDNAAADAIARLVAARPGVVSEALKFDLKLDR
jgi:hypothetical protein